MDMRSPILLLLSLVLVTSPAAADQLDPGFSGGADTTICHVSTGGLWEQAEKYGSWRVIVRNLGWEHTRSYVYLQWLKTDDKKKEMIEYKTIPVPEFTADNWRNVINIEYQNEAFTICYIIRGRKKIHKAILKPKVPGEYKIIF
jgi:hypothetical protein